MDLIQSHVEVNFVGFNKLFFGNDIWEWHIYRIESLQIVSVLNLVIIIYSLLNINTSTYTFIYYE